MGWRRMHGDFPDLVKAPPRLRLSAQPKRAIQCLTGPELIALFDWLKASDPKLYAMGLLQALCGLRVYEAAYLRRRDVNATEGTVTIAETKHHAPKTQASRRTIPVPAVVLEAIEAVRRAQKVIPTDGELFTDARHGIWVNTSLSHRWMKTLRRAAAELKNPRYAQTPSRKLRSAFVTLASQLGASDRVVKAYIGHVAGDVLGNHYYRIGPDDLKAVSALMGNWYSTRGAQKSCQDVGNSASPQLVNG
jgi:integrase